MKMEMYANWLAWRDVADVWGGNTISPAVKRGDICLIESMS